MFVGPEITSFKIFIEQAVTCRTMASSRNLNVLTSKELNEIEDSQPAADPSVRRQLCVVIFFALVVRLAKVHER